MLKINAFQRAYLVLENRRECRKQELVVNYRRPPMMTRYEELTRKSYSILAAINRCYAVGSHRFGWLWTAKFNALMAQRDALTIEEAEAPAVNPRMGGHALS